MDLAKLKAGTNNKKTTKFPGTGEDVVLHVLSEADRKDAHFAAQRHFEAEHIEVNAATVEAYEAEKTLQMIYRATTDAEGKPLAKTVDEFRKLITRDEKSMLVDEYLSLEEDCSPGLGTLSDGDLETLIEDFKKNPLRIGSVSSISTARQLIACLVSRLANSQKDSGSISS